MSENTETQVTVSALETVDALYNAYTTDYHKFVEKGTAQAAARARKALSALAKTIKLARKELQLAKVAKVAEKRAAKAAAKARVTE